MTRIQQDPSLRAKPEGDIPPQGGETRQFPDGQLAIVFDQEEQVVELGWGAGNYRGINQPSDLAIITLDDGTLVGLGNSKVAIYRPEQPEFGTVTVSELDYGMDPFEFRIGQKGLDIPDIGIVGSGTITQCMLRGPITTPDSDYPQITADNQFPDLRILVGG
jgi:hypothetical protein